MLATDSQFLHLSGVSLLQGSTLMVDFQALSANIRLGWKGLAVANPLPYYDTTKSIGLRHDVQLINNKSGRFKTQ